jgi:cytosine/adenosine deaminase-related metal-dependent hydrolase
MDILIKGVLAITMNDQNDILEHADVAIKGDRIVYVGQSRDWDEGSFEKVIHAERMILIPGLINSHTHSTQNLLRGMFQGLPLEIWRQYYRAALRIYDREALRISSMLGCIEMIRNGITTVLDHFDSPLKMEFKGASSVIEAMIDSGIRGVIAYTISDRPYEDTLPIPKNEVDPDALGAMDLVTSDEAISPENALQECEKFIQAFHGFNPRIYPIIGPSAPQRCTDRFLMDVKRLARDHGLMLHTHVLETKTQRVHAQKMFNRATMISHLREIGFLGPEVAIAHAIWISVEDIKVLSEEGTSVIHLPASNLKLGSGLAPLRLMLDQGVNVSVATDGAASNDSQNMFEAMKLAALIHNLTDRDYSRWISSREALTMSTIHAAKVCGLEKEIGSIEEGKLADLVLLKKDSYTWVPLNDVINQLVYSENGRSVTTTIIGGEIVMDSGHLTHVDESRIYAEATALRERLNEHLRHELKRASTLEPVLRKMYFDSNKKEVE